LKKSSPPPAPVPPAPVYIRSELATARPDAPQHGFRAVKDPELLVMLADSGIRMNLTLASNIKTGLVAGYKEHPIRTLFDAGVKVTLNTDDYGAFGVPVIGEFHELYACKIFSAAELEQIRKNGLADS